jgi:hypothetical protein
MFKQITGYTELICCPLVLAALIAPLAASADCSFQAGSSTPQAVFDQSCRQQGGVPHGCSCDARGAGNAGGGGYNPQQQMMMQGAGILGNALGKAMSEALFGNPQQDAAHQAEATRRTQEATQAAEQQRQMDEQRRIEEARQQDLAKQRILGSLKDRELSTSLVLKTEDNNPSLGGHELKLKLGDTENQKPKPDAFNKGFQASSECYSQNAGPYCSGFSGNEWQSCLDDYRSGYQVGDKQRVQILNEATSAGKDAGAKGELNNAASDPRALGPCRTQWIDAYTRGYSQGKPASVTAK